MDAAGIDLRTMAQGRDSVTALSDAVQNAGHKGENLLQQVHDSSPDHAVVSGKVADVSLKFEELQQKLRSLKEALANKIKDTDDFNAKVDDLEGCIQDAREKLAAVGPVSTDPTAVKKQLDLVRDLNAQLEEKKPTLEDAQGLCGKLTDQNKDEPLIVAAIKDKLDKVESPFEDLKAKITELEGRLQAAQIRSQEFNVSFSEFKDKLQDMEELSANQRPVSAVYDTLKQQRNDDEELKETIRYQEPVFDQLMKNGNNLLESAEPGAEKDEFEAKLADIERHWDNIKQNTSEHLARVHSALPEAQKYDESASSLGPWLTETEEKLVSLEPIVASQDSLEKLSNVVGLLRDDIDQHKPDRDSVSAKSEAVIELTEADGDIVRSDAQDAVERYDVAKNKEDLNNTKALIQQLEDVKENLDKAEASGQKVVDAINALDGDPSLVQDELAAVRQKYDTLLDQLKDKQTQLEQAIEQGTQLQDKLDEIQAWNADSVETVEDWEPISTDPVTAKNN